METMVCPSTSSGRGSGVEGHVVTPGFLDLTILVLGMVSQIEISLRLSPLEKFCECQCSLVKSDKMSMYSVGKASSVAAVSELVTHNVIFIFEFSSVILLSFNFLPLDGPGMLSST